MIEHHKMKTIREIVSNRVKPEWLDKTVKEFITEQYKKIETRRSPDGIWWYIYNINTKRVLGAGKAEDAAWEQAANRIIFNDYYNR